MPIDCAIHAYRGSTTNEKIKVLNKYDPKKNPNIPNIPNKSDPKNNVLKDNSKSADENFLEHKKLIDLCIEKLNLDVCVVCEIPPMKNVEQYRDKNEKIDEINNLITSYYSYKRSFKISYLNANIKSVNSAVNKDNNNGIDSIGYNFLYFDNVHLNYQHGVPLLKNWLLSL